MPFMNIPISWNQVTAFRLTRHHLLERAPEHMLAKVAGDIAGVQTQLLSAAQLGLWARVRNIQPDDVDSALQERSLVKAAAMRQTQFLLPAEQLAIFVRGSARRAEKDIRWTLGKGVPERTIEAVVAATLEALDQPRTRPEIAERVCRTLAVPLQTVEGGVGWGSRNRVAAVPVGEINFPVVYLLRLVAARGVICSGPNRGGEPTFVRADAWLPAWHDLPVEQAEVLLLRQYLRAFGPATVADFALWSGMTLTEARAIWAREQADLAEVAVEGWQAAVLRADLPVLAGLEAGPAPALLPVRLLPYFDTFLLGHKDREHLAVKADQQKIFRPQGWIAPVVLAAGRAAATWAYAQAGDTLRVLIRPFQELPAGVQGGIEAEARQLNRFLGAASVDVVFEPPSW